MFQAIWLFDRRKLDVWSIRRRVHDFTRIAPLNLHLDPQVIMCQKDLSFCHLEQMK